MIGINGGRGGLFRGLLEIYLYFTLDENNSREITPLKPIKYERKYNGKIYFNTNKR
ncbi:MAG TPA: hypothetical protein VMW09_01685 [Desulfatiglandales bacterium]|nr:hypothetical protein [Desulfatiglandales bacterium]